MKRRSPLGSPRIEREREFKNIRLQSEQVVRFDYQPTACRKTYRMVVDTLVSDWAYRVMASLAWTLKAWYALLLPVTGRWREKHQAEKQTVLRMEFKRFVNAFVQVPCQIVKTGRRVVYRLLAWNPWQAVFLRAFDALRYPLRC